MNSFFPPGVALRSLARRALMSPAFDHCWSRHGVLGLCQPTGTTAGLILGLAAGIKLVTAMDS